MPLATPLLLIARWVRPGRAGVAREQEPADLGTAIGMERWLDESEGEGEELRAAAPAAGWWARLRRRPQGF